MTLASARRQLSAALWQARKHDEVFWVANKHFGRAFREKRTGLLLSLRETARDMGITPRHLCDLEHGRRGWTENTMQFRLRKKPTRKGK